MTKWFIPIRQRVPPDLTDLNLDFDPCEVMNDVSKLLSVKREIQELTQRLSSAAQYYRWLATQYQRRASEICESETGHQYERNLYDPYSEMICVRCHKHKGE